MAEEILLDRENGVATVTLNRPHAMNALNAALRKALSLAMIEIRDDPDIRAVIITGAGDRAFTAGLDLKELGSSTSPSSHRVITDPLSNPIYAIESCGKPVIGAINGVAVTGGFELAVACDILMASTNARFADTHALVGLLPGWGLSQKLSRIIGLGRAKELSLSGRYIDAQTAFAWGLVNHVVTPDTLMSEARALAARIASLDPVFVRSYRKLIEDGYSMPYAAALEHERLFSGLHNMSVTASDIDRRRQDVIARGRAQS